MNGSSGISSGAGTMMPIPGISQQVAEGMQYVEAANSSIANMSAAASQSSPAKYVRVWEGGLSGQRQGLPVFITKLEVCFLITQSDLFMVMHLKTFFCSENVT
ncbi:hypothetical protein GIB67_010395 [Kingdonia uniflora]|uniref:Uncharacterized protein n=1 Tax=Kingdonia uniflora TaxID=39325 RepID=A0A7J7MAA6_9MAGN|nr:hypothetical protein GIB67_010395 [Kingdonia uniflora]